MSKKHKAMVKRLQKLSHEMIMIGGELQGLSPENGNQLVNAGLMVSEWAEDIMIDEKNPDSHS